MEYKNIAAYYQTDRDFSELLKVFFEIAELKRLFRQGWIRKGLDRSLCESVADHSFSMTVMTLLICDSFFPMLNREKAVLMSLLHEIGEIYAGDIVPDDNIDASIKSDMELQSVKSVFSKLPDGEKYIELWLEFEEGKTPESRLVRQIDKLEMALQAEIYSRVNGLQADDFMNSARKAVLAVKLADLMQEISPLIET